jgi:hypothetical protein
VYANVAHFRFRFFPAFLENPVSGLRPISVYIFTCGTLVTPCWVYVSKGNRPGEGNMREEASRDATRTTANFSAIDSKAACILLEIWQVVSSPTEQVHGSLSCWWIPYLRSSGGGWQDWHLKNTVSLEGNLIDGACTETGFPRQIPGSIIKEVSSVLSAGGFTFQKSLAY